MSLGGCADPSQSTPELGSEHHSRACGNPPAAKPRTRDHQAPVHIEAVGALEPVDVTGAGDTVIATFTLGLACDASFSDAARLANYTGGLVVMKRGTASVTGAELEHSILSDA